MRNPRDKYCDGGNEEAAFTLIELILITGVIAILALIAVPVLANGKASSQRAICARNLSDIGRALAIWGSDRGDLFPWQVDYAGGGTRRHPSGLNANTWYQFAWLSNELGTPKVLACPSDRLAKVSQDFGNGTNGLIHATHRNNAISYSLSHPYPEHGRLVVSSDRSMKPDNGVSGGCGFFPNQIYGFGQAPTSGTWGDFMHAAGGNLLFNDGSVEQVDDRGLGRAIDLYYPPPQIGDRVSRPHFIFPRDPMISINDN